MFTSLSRPNASTGRERRGRACVRLGMSSPTASRSGLNGWKNWLVPEVVLVERRDRERHDLPRGLRAPLPPERHIVGVVERDAVRRRRDRRRPARSGRAARPCARCRPSARRRSRSRGSPAGIAYVRARANSTRAGIDRGGYGSTVSSNSSFANANVSWSTAVLLSFMYERPCVAPKLPLCRCSAMSRRNRSSTIAARCASSASGANSTSVEQRRDVLLVVDVGVPLGEAEAHLLVEPVEDARVRGVGVLGAGAAVVGERRVGEGDARRGTRRCGR